MLPPATSLFWRPRKRVSPPGDQPILNESQIHSGDFIGVIRLDGLDPVLAFGMGSHTGHTAVALWEETWLVDVTPIVGGVFFSDVLPCFQNFRLLKLLYSLCLFFSILLSWESKTQIQGWTALYCREHCQWFLLVGRAWFPR